MDGIEQAVFTSAVTDRAAGYQVVATSPGVSEEDVRELAIWGPSHGALLDGGPGAVSINFHPLPSGAHCVSRTVPSGWEYSGRGARIYTQCLIVPPEVLSRLANNPFAVIKAALAAGLIRVYDEVPPRLEPFRLAGRASMVDTSLLSELAANLGEKWMATLIQAALNSHTLALVGGPPPEHVVAGIFNCLPPRCRTEFSFSTGLRFSSRRPFRIVALSKDPEELHRVQRLYDVVVLDLSGDPPQRFAPLDSWARLVQRVIRCKCNEVFTSALSQRHSDVTREDLPVLGLQLLEEMDASCCDDSDDETVFHDALPADTAKPRPAEPVGKAGAEAASEPSKSAERTQQAHAAHARFEKTSSAPAACQSKFETPSQRLDPGSTAMQHRLQQIDAMVYEAITGNAEVIEQLKSQWSTLRAEMSKQLMARTREEYMRYALAIWESCTGADGVRSSQHALQSLDVFCVLFDEV